MNPIPLFFARLSLIILFLICCLPVLYGQDIVVSTQQETEWISDFYEENEQCFRCHQTGITPSDELTEDEINNLGSHGLLFSREDFYNSNHRTFACIHCHGNDDTDLRELADEGVFTCTNCHGFDAASDQYHFAEKAEQYNKSVHANLENVNFSCWKCHNPHVYKSNIRNTTDIHDTITYHNNICLDCHSKRNHVPTNPENDSKIMLEHHNWLPNQPLHISKVKCIECHTQIINSDLLTHLILPGEQAKMRCVDCHSKESRLLATLYKFQAKEQRSKAGFFNGMLLEELRIIGTSGSSYLNIASVVIFLLTLLGIALHIYFRVRMNRTKLTN